MPSTSSIIDVQCKVFVGNLSFFCTKENLESLFRPFGEIDGVYICKSKEGEPLYYGFVHFIDPSSAHTAIAALNNTHYRGRVLRVHQGHSSRVSRHSNEGVEILVSFLSYQVDITIDEEVLYHVFSQFGRVLDCVVKHFAEVRESANPRACRQNGYGFVTLQSIDVAQRVIHEVKSSTIPFLDHSKTNSTDSHSPVGPIIMLDCKLSRNSSIRLQTLLGNATEDKSSLASPRESGQASLGSNDSPVMTPGQPVPPSAGAYLLPIHQGAHPELYQHSSYPPSPPGHIPPIQPSFYPVPSLSSPMLVTASNGTLYTSSPNMDVALFASLPPSAMAGFAHMVPANQSQYFVNSAPPGAGTTYSISHGPQGQPPMLRHHHSQPHSLSAPRVPNGSYPAMVTYSPQISHGAPSPAMYAPQHAYQVAYGLSPTMPLASAASGSMASSQPDGHVAKDHRPSLPTSKSAPQQSPRQTYTAANDNHQGSTPSHHASPPSPRSSGERPLSGLPPPVVHHLPQHYPQQPQPTPYLQAYPPNFFHR